MAPKHNQSVIRMWPSPELVSKVFDWGNAILVLGLVVTAFATVAVIWAANRKEEVLDRDLAESRERTAILEQQAGESGKEIARLSVEAKTAEEEIAKANEKAAEAALGIESARANAEAAKADAERAKQFTAEAKERAAKLEIEAAQARIEAERLKAAVAWRFLTPEMQDKIRRAIGKQQGSFNLAYTLNDPESQLFAIQIANLFLPLGWKVAFSGKSFLDGVVFGVRISGEEQPETAAIRSAFTAAGIEYSIDPLPQQSQHMGANIEGALTIMVGSRPPPM